MRKYNYVKRKYSKNFKWSNNMRYRKDYAVLVISKRRQLAAGKAPEVYKWLVKIDAEDVDMVNHHHWRIDPKGYPATWTLRDDGKYDFIMLHRFIADAPDGTYIDHIDHDIFDCRKDNLRQCDTMSCIASNSKRATFGVHHFGCRQKKYYVSVKDNSGGSTSIAKFNTLKASRDYAVMVRDMSAEERKSAFIQFKINESGRIKLHHIRKQNNGYTVVVRFRTYKKKYYRFCHSEAEAIKTRDGFIRAYADEMFTEGSSG